MKLDILRVNTTKGKGGAGQTASRLDSAINNLSGIRSVFAYGRGRSLNQKNSFEFSYKSEIYLHAGITRFTGLEGYGTYFSTQKLINYVKQERFDLVHLHNIHGYYLDFSFIEFLKKRDIPVVWTFHDVWPITGSCGFFMKCNKWKTGCGNCPNKYRYPKNYIDNSDYMWKRKREIFSKGWDPVIVSPSSWLRDRVKESFLKDFKVKVIPNGINTKLFKPREQKSIRKEFNLPQDKKIVLFVAADLKNKRKGAKYFFDSLSKVKAKNWMVVTVGKKMNIKNRENIEIEQLGYISNRSKIARVYNAADLFCITALQDNLPTTVNESLASGVPVIGFSSGGIPEQVTDECGILVEKKNTRELARAISRLLNNNQKRNKMSKKCRERAVNNYSIPKFRDAYLEVYKQIVQKEL